MTSPLDLENFEVNNRLIMSRYCSWHYRGNGCNYNGIPLATEEGGSLIVGDPVDWFTNQARKEWSAQNYYYSGDAAYLENKKITIANRSNSSQTEFAKIWYVCQADHNSSRSTIPDKNPSLWTRDGCNKKLDGCQLRFGKGSLEFNAKPVDRTANFVDFTSRSYNSRFNDIAYAIAYTTGVSGSSETIASPVWSVTDQFTGAPAGVWKTSGAATVKTGAMLYLEWPTSRNINRIDIYDNVDVQSNFNNAYIRLFNSAGAVVRSGTLAVPTNGARATTGFANQSVKKIIISGSGVLGTGPPSLCEVAVFETNPPHLVYNDQETLHLHRNNFFQIATWIGFTGRDLYPNELYSVFNNISGNCRYSAT